MGVLGHGQQASGAGGVGGPYRVERERLPVAPPPQGGAVGRSRRGRGPVGRGEAAGEAADGPVDAQIMAALMRLPGRQRQVVALRLFLDLDTVRTAEVLGIAPGTVTAHLARAIATLRDDLTSADQQETLS